MNADIKRQWIAALRSGEYQQTRGRLRNNGGYCCMGVLCDLHAKESGGLWTGSQEDGWAYRFEGVVLPSVVADWAGIAGLNPMVDGAALGYRNDNGGTFDEIADLIEAFIQDAS